MKSRTLAAASIGEFTRVHGIFLCLLFIALMLYSTKSESGFRSNDASTVKVKNSSLGLIGFNYTNKTIENYSVDGVGGGNIWLSSNTSGGGGVTCCIDYSSVKLKGSAVKVRWQMDGCLYLMTNEITGASQKVRHLYYKEVTVNVEDVSRGRPQYIETHLYPDGGVKVLLTREISNPLVRFGKNRRDQSNFPRCKDGKRPG